MRTALLYCGEGRTVHQTWENHRWYLRVLPNPDVFVSIADDKDADDMLLLKRAFPKARFEMEKVVQPEIPEPKEETMFRSGYPRSVPARSVLRQLWAFNRAWEFFSPQVAEYDLIVRVRPDVAFCRCAIPDFYNDDRFVPKRREVLVEDKLCLVTWGMQWGGVCDRFAIMGKKAAEAWFTTFQRWQAYFDEGAPLHPEQLVALSLERAGVEPRKMRCEFITIRPISAHHPNGAHVPFDPTVVDFIDANWRGL